MKILISNDDGVHSPGLLVLARAAARYGEVRVVAPEVERSSTGHAITHGKPVRWRRTAVAEFEAYSVNGTPADCVALGLHQFDDTDLVLAGVNLGSNLGTGMWHSGTLAAAKQATLLGLRGIALSTPVDRAAPDLGHVDGWLDRVLALLIPMESLRLVNVNFPKEPREIRWTRQSVREYDGRVVPASDPIGRDHFWLTVVALDQLDEGTDRWAIRNGAVSITPLRLDLTDEAALAAVLRDASAAMPG